MMYDVVFTLWELKILTLNPFECCLVLTSSVATASPAFTRNTKPTQHSISMVWHNCQWQCKHDQTCQARPGHASTELAELAFLQRAGMALARHGNVSPASVNNIMLDWCCTRHSACWVQFKASTYHHTHTCIVCSASCISRQRLCWISPTRTSNSFIKPTALVNGKSSGIFLFSTRVELWKELAGNNWPSDRMAWTATGLILMNNE